VAVLEVMFALTGLLGTSWLLRNTKNNKKEKQKRGRRRCKIWLKSCCSDTSLDLVEMVKI